MAEHTALKASFTFDGELEISTKPSAPLSENAVLKAVQKGDAEAYQGIVQRYKQTAYYIALGFVHNHQDALDISQDAFIKAFRKIKTFQPDRPFFPWFYQILKHLCLDHLKRKSRRKEVPLEDVFSVEHKGIDREMKDTLRRGLFDLPSEQREVIILRYFQQLSYREIAETTGKPPGTVMSSLYYAKKNLKSILQKYLGRKIHEQG